jgi:hypothetical protein
VYDLKDGKTWQPLAKDLVTTLQSEWNAKVRFRDGGGRVIPLPTALMPEVDSNQ